MEKAEAGWYPDPEGSGRRRWWTGAGWGDLDRVSQDQTRSPGWYPYPDNPDKQRYWDGTVWSEKEPGSSIEPGWYPDPSSGSALRWWDGTTWGGLHPEHVYDQESRPPNWYQDPQGTGELRYWDGSSWGLTQGQYMAQQNSASQQTAGLPLTAPPQHTRATFSTLSTPIKAGIAFGAVVLVVIVGLVASSLLFTSPSSKATGNFCNDLKAALTSKTTNFNSNSAKALTRSSMITQLNKDISNLDESAARLRGAASEAPSPAIATAINEVASKMTALIDSEKQLLSDIQALPASATPQQIADAMRPAGSAMLKPLLTLFSSLKPYTAQLQKTCPALG